MKMSKNQKYAPGVCEKHICEHNKIERIWKSFSGDAPKLILQKSARDSRHRMKCRSSVIWVMRKCASGEGNNDIYEIVHFREIRICYVYHGHSDTRDLCFENCSGFIVFLFKNRAAARRCLSTLSRKQP